MTGNVSDDKTDDNRLIHNELLCYVQFHMRRCPKQKIVDVVGRCFSVDVIMQARDVLNNTFGDKLSAKLKQRRNGQGKVRSDITLDDIVSAMMELDQNNIVTNFGAKDIMSLPKCDPKDVDNFAVLERVMLLEERIKSFEKGLSENVVKIMTNSDKIDVLSDEVKTHGTLLLDKLEPATPTFAEIIASEVNASSELQDESRRDSDIDVSIPSGDSGASHDTQSTPGAAANTSNTAASTSNTSNDNASVMLSAVSDGSSNGSGGPPSGPSQSGGSSISSGVLLNGPGTQSGTRVSLSNGGASNGAGRSSTGGASSGSGWSSNGGASSGSQPHNRAKHSGTVTGNSNSWNVVGRNGKAVVANGQRQNRKRVIEGNVQSDVIRGAPPPKRDFFISRVLPHTDDESFKKFICDNVVRNFELSLTSNSRAKFKSYKLSVDITDRDKVFRPEVWPMGVKLQRWRVRNDSEKRDGPMNTA